MNKASKNIVIRLFNMVEVTLAIAVVGIGVAGIMSLFPVAVSSNRDAIADNYSGDVADQSIAYISALATKGTTMSEWNTNFIGNVPDTAPSDSDLAPGNAGANVIGNLYTNASATPGVFKVLVNSGTVTDFSAYVKFWRTELPAVYIAGVMASAGWDENNKFGAGIHLEISYPGEAPYAQRKKLYYYFEVYNPYPF